ncbi:MAG TPA: GntR family transcriptional regulator [Burkholderiaceae bacterium]|nr:GntR family transcriptional regulator [Burkholderiaceae bacterium]
MSTPASETQAIRRTGRQALTSVEIYDRLRQMARTFRFKPGERINEIELSKALAVSRTPLREVLNQLMVEGFVTRHANKGFVGRALDPQQVFELYEFRQGLEVNIARLACARATDGEIGELEAFVQSSTDVSEDEYATRLLALDEEFHMRLARMARNGEYLRTLENLNARIYYVRWIDMRRGRRKHTQAEHMRIARALRARNEARMVGLMSAHIGQRLDQIVENIKTGFAEIYMRPDALTT